MTGYVAAIACNYFGKDFTSQSENVRICQITNGEGKKMTIQYITTIDIHYNYFDYSYHDMDYFSKQDTLQQFITLITSHTNLTNRQIIRMDKNHPKTHSAKQEINDQMNAYFCSIKHQVYLILQVKFTQYG